MSETVIKIENLSKLYRLGELGTGTLSHDINRWWHRVRGKEDPYVRIGATNDRTKKNASDWVWALRDLSFSVRRGEILGVIGRNGAGKSTLLKILSRVTAPTSGTIKSKGRIASLLEVGTGFHPDLTGRENIYLNGAILGMQRAEITKKLNDIVEFSGCQAYLDTPVRRYSSGMHVRLGFAVGAHLDPEILIVDEVLAVGDAEFQARCLGKLHEMSGQGRTVMLVSHNLSLVSSVCTRGLLLKNGDQVFSGDIDETLQYYSKSGLGMLDGTLIRDGKCIQEASSCRTDNSKCNVFQFGETIRIRMKLSPQHLLRSPQIGIGFNSALGSRVMTIGTFFSENRLPTIDSPCEIVCDIPAPRLLPSTYTLRIAIRDDASRLELDAIEDEFSLTICPSDVFGSGSLPSPQQGFIGQTSTWTIA